MGQQVRLASPSPANCRDTRPTLFPTGMFWQVQPPTVPSRQPCSKKHERLVDIWTGEAVGLFEFLGADVEGLNGGCDGDVDGAGDDTRLNEFVRFADVYQN